MIEFLIIGLILFGIFYFGFKPTKKSNKKVIKKGYIKPKYHGYHGGFWKVNQCSDCGIVGMYEDLHTVDPCPECGAKVKGRASAKFVKGDDDEWYWKTREEFKRENATEKLEKF